MKSATRLVLMLAATVSTAATLAVAQEGQKPPQMTAEEKAMMEAYVKAATPGPQHQWLAAKAGTWEVSGKSWTSPTAAVTPFTGSVERTMMLGGRVLAEKVKSSDMMGMAFEGYGLTGYDNTTGEFWGTWNDSMGTGLMTSTGKCDDKGACTQMGEFVDPATGKKKTSRMTSRDEGPDKEVHEMFDRGPDGKEFRSMELVYTRQK
jgi:hypothetical protein